MLERDGIKIVGAQEITVERRGVKRARISVNEDMRIRVVLPLDFSQEQIDDLLERKATRIQKELAFFRGRRDARIQVRRNQILYLGEAYTFRLLPGLRRNFAINAIGQTIFSGINLLEDGVLDRWYRKEAKRVIMERLAHIADTYNLTYNRVFIRDQKTLWGSCSSEKNLSFNWRLIQTPLDIIDYIVAHELVHTEILRHTEAFWAKVGSLYPQHRQARVWLRNFQPDQ
ncbi:MAG: M48 family metallopeptidase [Desulfobacterales bacterium]|nr:M48 family metallopeptidase [Desulfobacterales bacterium]